MTLNLFYTGLIQSLIFLPIVYCVMLTFRILRFPDLTSEGSYTFTSVVFASLIAMDCCNFHPILAVCVAIICGGLCGVFTLLISMQLKINSLLASIITISILYSLNLMILKTPNIGIPPQGLFLVKNSEINFILLCAILAVVILPIALFLFTEKGLCIRAMSLHQEFAKKQGIFKKNSRVVSIFVANALAGLAGILMEQMQQYVDINMGMGLAIYAFCSLMIGESLVGNRTLARQLIAPIVGVLAYQQLQGLVLSLGMQPSNLKMFTGILLLSIVGMKSKNAKQSTNYGF